MTVMILQRMIIVDNMVLTSEQKARLYPNKEIGATVMATMVTRLVKKAINNGEILDNITSSKTRSRIGIETKKGDLTIYHSFTLYEIKHT